MKSVSRFIGSRFIGSRFIGSRFIGSRFIGSRFIGIRSVMFTLAIAAVFSFSGCSSQPIIPDAKNVKLARENPPAKCVEIGPVQGSVSSVHGTIEQAIEDMKLDAARKGANYVRMESTSAYGTSTSGTAYQCP